MPVSSDKILTTLITASKASGDVLASYFNQPLTATIKSTPADYQTEADMAANNAVMKILERDLPDFNIQSEEAEFIDKKSDFTVVIDPLDGTNNFFLGIPVFCTMLAVLEKHEIICGVIYEPLLKRLTYAQKNQGAWQQIGDEAPHQIFVNDISSCERATIDVLWGYNPPAELVRQTYAIVGENKFKRLLKCWCCLTFALVANGKIEGSICFDIPSHDILAGKLICNEAGARITNIGPDTDVNGTFIISNTVIHGELVEVFGPILRKYC